MREEAEKWFKQAIEDLSTAKDTINTGHYYAAVFWAQQAAEKALKSLLLNLGKTIRSHDLNELLNIIKTESSISVDEIRDDVRKLTVQLYDI